MFTILEIEDEIQSFGLNIRYNYISSLMLLCKKHTRNKRNFILWWLQHLPCSRHDTVGMIAWWCTTQVINSNLQHSTDHAITHKQRQLYQYVWKYTGLERWI